MTQVTQSIETLSTEELERILAERKKADQEEANARRAHYEAIKDSAASEMVQMALRMEEAIKDFKVKSFDTMDSVYEVLKEYSKRKETSKGNFEIVSANGQYKVQYSRQDTGTFDERSTQAEKHIKDFLTKRYDEDDLTKELILNLLERKRGSLDIRLVQKLYSMEDKFDDENWREGIRLLKESYQASDSKSYIKFYEKGAQNEWRHVKIDFASI